MCISIEEWKFFNTFAPWFSAAGTFLAVGTSLYISFSTRKIDLEISSGIYNYDENGVKNEYLVVDVTNTGYRTIRLDSYASISFQVGLSQKTNIGIGKNYIDFNKSSSFPCILGENETAKLFINMKHDNQNWLHNFKEEQLKNLPISSIKIIVCPNIGKPFKIKPDKLIMRKLGYG
jgi:hypothetical protein